MALDKNFDIPFAMEGGGAEAFALEVERLFVRARQVSAQQYVGKNPQSAPGGNVVDRQAVSIVVQGLFMAMKPTGLTPFDLFDGIGQAVGSQLGCAPEPMAHATLQFLYNQIRGYEHRTRSSMAGVKNG